MTLRGLTLAIEIALFFGVVAYGAAAMPDRVALHWGLDGEPNRIGTRAEWVIETGVIGIVLLLLIGAVSLLVAKGPVSILNVPHKEHWTKPENTPRVRELLLDDVCDILGDAVLLVTVIELIAVVRARSGSLDFPTPLFLLVLGVFLASVAFRLFKMPGRYTPR